MVLRFSTAKTWTSSRTMTAQRFFVASTLVALVSLLVGWAAGDVGCPATISARQQLATPVAGWTATEDDTPHNLSGITFYDGPPSEKASLVYDRITHGKTEQVATWTFAARKDRPIWLACSYARTSIELAKTLPTSITMCTVTYDTQQTIDGMPVVKKIACK
jgi:hypothetical protein